MTAYRKAEEVSRFGVELTTQTLQALDNGEKLIALFDQESQMVIPKELQLIYLGLFFSGAWSQKSPKQVRVEKIRILGEFYQGRFGELPKLVKGINSLKNLTKAIVQYTRSEELVSKYEV